ncbi:hypothetical protein DIPPA_00537 [Diplonema papillatum]|nr:hypothetical protein DIPPA_00537 [Diplonema papillatum]
MSLPPLQKRPINNMGRQEGAVLITNKPEFEPYAMSQWEAVAVPVSSDAGDLGRTSPKNKPSATKSRKKKDSTAAQLSDDSGYAKHDSWHHRSGVFDSNAEPKAKRKEKRS